MSSTHKLHSSLGSLSRRALIYCPLIFLYSTPILFLLFFFCKLTEKSLWDCPKKGLSFFLLFFLFAGLVTNIRGAIDYAQSTNHVGSNFHLFPVDSYQIFTERKKCLDSRVRNIFNYRCGCSELCDKLFLKNNNNQFNKCFDDYIYMYQVAKVWNRKIKKDPSMRMIKWVSVHMS